MKTNKRRLYESIMKDVSKTVKLHLNENELYDDSYEINELNDKIDSIIKQINETSNSYLDIDEDGIDIVIWGILDGITDNKQDDAVLTSIKTWLDNNY